jgi:predicted GNAT family acetyltransferase
MQVIQKNGPHNGTFIATHGDDVIGEMTYLWAGDKHFIINYTEVADQYRGQGIGKKMVEKAVEYARENHCTIFPQCSYVRTVFDRNPGFNDVRG